MKDEQGSECAAAATGLGPEKCSTNSPRVAEPSTRNQVQDDSQVREIIFIRITLINNRSWKTEYLYLKNYKHR